MTFFYIPKMNSMVVLIITFFVVVMVAIVYLTYTYLRKKKYKEQLTKAPVEPFGEDWCESIFNTFKMFTDVEKIKDGDIKSQLMNNENFKKIEIPERDYLDSNSRELDDLIVAILRHEIKINRFGRTKGNDFGFHFCDPDNYEIISDFLKEFFITGKSGEKGRVIYGLWINDLYCVKTYLKELFKELVEDLQDHTVYNLELPKYFCVYFGEESIRVSQRLINEKFEIKSEVIEIYDEKVKLAYIFLNNANDDDDCVLVGEGKIWRTKGSELKYEDMKKMFISFGIFKKISD